MSEAVTTIAAQPDWFAVEARGDLGRCLWHPIVAWRSVHDADLPYDEMWAVGMDGKLWRGDEGVAVVLTRGRSAVRNGRWYGVGQIELDLLREVA